MMELFALINREKLFVFAQNVELGYADVETLSYHNVAHACEVIARDLCYFDGRDYGG